MNSLAAIMTLAIWGCAVSGVVLCLARSELQLVCEQPAVRRPSSLVTGRGLLLVIACCELGKLAGC